MAPLETKIKITQQEIKKLNIGSGKLDAQLNSTKDQQEYKDHKLTMGKHGVVAVALVVLWS
jgi:hypothetical protein